MTDKLKVPAKADFDNYANLMDKQAGHFKELDNWVTAHCHDASDLDGLLLWPICDLAPRLASEFSAKLTQCSTGMTGIAAKARETATDYTTHEHTTAHTFTRLYGTPLPHFPDIAKVPGLHHLGDFTDEPPDLKATDLDPAGDATAKNIAMQLTALGVPTDEGSAGLQRERGLRGWVDMDRTPMNAGAKVGNFSGKILSMADNLFHHFTGHSLVELLIEPIAGNYGRLQYLQGAYGQLADGIYTVTGTSRKGSVRLGGEWIGNAAVAFDSLMFRWTMGSGGIGDAAKLVSDMFRDGFYAVSGLVEAALQAITRLINKEAHELVKTVEGDGAIEAVGGGPEDPVVDVVAGLWTMWKVHTIIKGMIFGIKEIHKIFGQIKAAVSKIEADITAVINTFARFDVYGQVGSLLDQERQWGFEFEKISGWDPREGAVRMSMLPSP